MAIISRTHTYREHPTLDSLTVRQSTVNLMPCERTHLGVKMLSQSRSRARSSMDVTARAALGRARGACRMHAK